MYVYMYIYIYIYVHTYTYIYICTCMYTHTHIHTYDMLVNIIIVRRVYVERARNSERTVGRSPLLGSASGGNAMSMRRHACARRQHRIRSTRESYDWVGPGPRMKVTCHVAWGLAPPTGTMHGRRIKDHPRFKGN